MSERQQKARLMWVDLTVSVRQSELPDQFRESFDIIRPSAGSSLESEIKRLDPALLLFDFDYPERPGLKLLENTKSKFPSIPLIMMTVQHSESLAVWAFRARVWDYLVKPTTNRELSRCLPSLLEILATPRRRTRLVHSKASPIPQESRVTPRSTTPAELMPALAFIENNFREKVTSAQVAKACSMDSFKFSRVFKAAFGITFKEYLMRVRIKEACRLMEKPDISITEVAYLCGFSDASYFSRVFKRFAGVCPSEFASDSESRDILSDERLALIL